jgi:hypothetical protein
MSSSRHAGGAAAPPLYTLMLVLAALTASCGDRDALPAAQTPAADPSASPATRKPPEDEPAARQQDRAGSMTHAALIRRLDGRRLRVGKRVVRVDRATVTCGGVGRPAGRSDGEPAWSRFRCLQPTFPAGSVAGPDVIFIATPTGGGAVQISVSGFTRY